MADLDGYAFRKKGNYLVPSDIHSDEWLAKIKDGSEVLISARRSRSVRFHRLFFGLLRLVCNNDPEDRWPSEDSLLTDLKLRVRHVDTVINGFTGTVEHRPKSISFASMSEDEFRPFFNRCCNILATDVLSMAPQELAEEVFRMIDGDTKQGWKVHETSMESKMTRAKS